MLVTPLNTSYRISYPNSVLCKNCFNTKISTHKISQKLVPVQFRLGHKTDWLWSVDLCTRLCIKARKLNNLWCLDYVKHIAVSQKCIFINLETICEHELELFRAVYVVMRYSSIVYPHILSIFGHF